MNASSNIKIQNLSKLSIDELVKRDIFGRTILHLLILTNRHDLLRNLLKNRDVKLIFGYCDYESGWNCLHYVIFHKRLACFKVLVDFLKSVNLYQEICKAKDRNGQTPIQLLNNDFKDLLWIPESINQQNQCHLVYRFKHVSKSGKASETNSSEGLNQPDTTEVTNSVTSHLNLSGSEKIWNSKRCGSEIYVLGANNHNQLGVGDHKDRNVPFKLPHEDFKIDGCNPSAQIRFIKPRYKKIILSKNHSLTLTQDGRIFASGMGSRGRLGLGNLNNSTKFKLIHYFPDNNLFIRDFSISNNHSIALTVDNNLYGWGLNSYNQLGFRSATTTKDYRDIYEIKPTLILGDLKKNSNHINGIATSNVHSVVFTKSELFSWGLNIGQMGIPAVNPDLELNQGDIIFRGEVVNNPRSVSLRDEIKLITACDTCTMLVTVKDEIHVYFQFQHIKLPKIPTKGANIDHFKLFKPNRLTKPVEISKIVMKSITCIAVLLKAGDVFTFKLNPKDLKNVKYIQVWKAYDHGVNVTDLDVSENGSIILCTRNGSVFIKTDQALSIQKPFTEAGHQTLNIKNKFKKVDQLNKVLAVSCDPKFFSYGFIRDDIDMLPFEIQKNDFLEDINSLSPLVHVNLSRKQDLLLETDTLSNTYISRFLYPSLSEANDEEDVEEDFNTKDEGVKDVLFDNYYYRYDASFCKREFKFNTYEAILELEFAPLLEVLRMGPGVIGKLCLDSVSQKDYDCFIILEKYPDIRIGIHIPIFESRSVVFKQIFKTMSDEYFVKDGIRAKFDANSKELRLKGEVNLPALLLFVHFVYSNSTMHKTLSKFLPDIKDMREGYENLLKAFAVEPTLKSRDYLSQLTQGLQESLDNESSGDITVNLVDGIIRCHSSILKSRSAFFETVLSTRWENTPQRILDFSRLSVFQFKFILQHLYGQNNYDIFDYFESPFEDSDQFVNSLLEIIEIADELLLFQLKSLCQMVISDFINLENVTLLLIHSDYLSANKLFMNCCWYIYNNLEVLLFDSSLNDLSIEILRKLEKQVNFFQRCQVPDFANEKGIINNEILHCYFENDSTAFVSKFVNDIASFNEIFMDDRKGFEAFEPLVDIRLKAPAKPLISKTRKSSNKASMSDEVTKFRKSVSVTPKEVNQIAVSEDDEGFEVVTKGPRRASSTVSINKSPTPEMLATSNDLKGSNSGLKNVSILRNNPKIEDSNKSELKNKTFSYLQVTNNSLNEVKLSTSDATGILVDNSKKNELVNVNKKPQKVKMGPIVKLSQKERKRLNNQVIAEISNSENEGLRKEDKNPWGNSSLPTVSGSSGGDSSLTNNYTHVMPILGSAKANPKGKGKQNASISMKQTTKIVAPSPTFGYGVNGVGSMESLNKSQGTPESMNYEFIQDHSQVYETERKTLADIQKEEEFAKWWAQESLKVQKQLEKLDESKLKPSNTNKHKSKRAKSFAKPKNEKSQSGNNTDLINSKRRISSGSNKVNS